MGNTLPKMSYKWVELFPEQGREMEKWSDSEFKEAGIIINKVVPNPGRLEIKNKARLFISQLIYGKNLGWMGVIGRKIL